MNSLRWRIFANDILHHLVLLFAILLFLLAVCFSGLHLLLPLLVKNTGLVTRSLSTVVGAPVSFNTINVGWHRLQPEIDLTGLTISNSQHQVLMQIPQVDVRLNIFLSALHQKPEISLLQVEQWNIRTYQDTNLNWQISGIENLSTTPNQSQLNINEVLSALLQIKHLKLHECQIEIQPQSYPTIRLVHTDISWDIKHDQLAIYGNTDLQGPSNTTLQFFSQLSGNWSKFSLEELIGTFYLKLTPVELGPWLQQRTPYDLHWQQGHISGEIWANWQKNHWQEAAARLAISQLKLQRVNSKNPTQLRSQQMQLALNWQDKLLKFTIDAHQGELTLSQLFRNALPFQHLSINGDASGHHLSLHTAKFETAEMTLTAWLNFLWSDTQPLDMNLLAKIDLHSLNAVARYLPVGIMSESLVNWLDHAIVNGKNLQAEMLWRGPPSQFPFNDQSGTLQIFGQVTGVKLDYAPGWQVINDLNADLYFTGQGMHLVSHKMLLGAIPISLVTADIAFKHETNLAIYSKLSTDLATAWEFLAHSKLKNTLSFLLNNFKAQGPAALELKLNVPLSSEDSEVLYQGKLLLNHDQLTLLPFPIQMTQLTGTFNFSNQNISSKLTANWFDQAWQLNINKTTATQPMRLDLTGKIPVTAWVQQEFKFALNWFQGNPLFHAQATLQSDASPAFSMSLNSDLQGLRIHLPVGIGKEANVATPINVVLQQLADNSLGLKLNWSAPQGKILLSRAGGILSASTPIGSAKVIEPKNDQTPWQINLFDLDMHAIEDGVTDHLDTPERIPSMDIQATRIKFPTFDLKSLRLQLLAEENGGTRIKSLLINHEQFSLAAQGEFNKNSTRLNGNLTTANLAGTLQTLGFGNLIEASQATVNFDLSWLGTLWQFDRNHLTGKVNFNVSQGVFTNLSNQTNNKINLGRMFSLLSISELPQRLTSHFNDMTQKGFPFDQVTGQLNLAPARLNQIDVHIAGPVANVSLQGCMNTEIKKMNLVTQINPKLTGSLPVIAAFAGGPILGAIGLVANQVIQPLVGELSSSYYLITGNEQNPETVKINQTKAGIMLKNCPL